MAPSSLDPHRARRARTLCMVTSYLFFSLSACTREDRPASPHTAFPQGNTAPAPSAPPSESPTAATSAVPAPPPYVRLGDDVGGRYEQYTERLKKAHERLRASLSTDAPDLLP